MRVCIVSGTFPPDYWGGVEHYVEQLYTRLAQRKHQVTVLTQFYKTASTDPHIVQVRVPESEGKSYWSWMQQASRFLNSQEFDVVHGNELKGHLACLVSRHHRCVLTPHSWLTVRHSMDGNLQHMLGWTLKYASLFKASKILAPTDVIRRSIISTLNLPNQHRVITVPPGGVDLDLFTPTLGGESVRESFGLSSKFVIMYYGKVRPDKGITDILSAARTTRLKSPEVAIVVAGGPKGGPDRYYRHLRETQRDTIFTGFIPLTDAPRFLKAADIFSVYTPSGTPETFCQSLVQAMACGLPVVCSDIPVFREVTKGAALLVPPRRPDLLADAFMALKNNPHLREKLGRAARGMAEQYYSWDRVIDRIEKTYYELLE